MAQQLLPKIQEQAEQLKLTELKELEAHIQKLISAAEAAQDREIVVKKGHKIASHHHGQGKTYRWERVKCGKPNCKCARGELHGPYLYAYWFEGGRTRSQYIGAKGQTGSEST